MAIYGISSQTSLVWHAGAVFAIIFVVMGLNAIFRPRSGFEVFKFEYPKAEKDRKLIDGLMLIYGIRDVFMGFGMLAAYYFEAREVFGYLLIAGSLVAFVDGIANKAVIGHGEEMHWGYAPLLTVAGAILLGVVDGM